MCRGLDPRGGAQGQRATQFWWAGTHGDGAWRSLVTVVDIIDSRPYKISLPNLKG